MRAVVQRVSQASVRVGAEVVARLPAPGLLVLVGVAGDDDEADARLLADRIAGLRILPGETSARAQGAPVLLVSQFTLYGETRRGRRPSWGAAAPAAVAEPLFDLVAAELSALGVPVQTGRFGALMSVASVNEGPMTLILQT